MVFGCSHFFAELRLPPRNSPDHSLYFRRDFSIYHPDFIVQVDFTDPPKLEGGVCHKPLCCRRCRRTCDEAEVVYHPDSFTCLIFDRRKSEPMPQRQFPIYSSFLLVILLLTLFFLWVRISEATHEEFLHYSKSEARKYILLVREPFSRYLHIFLMSPRASNSLSAESTVFLSMLHSSAMSRRDGKQLTVFLSLCLSKQQ